MGAGRGNKLGSVPSSPTIRAARGVRDILPPERWRWRQVESAAHELARRYGFEELETPIIEPAELIERGVGEGSDAGGKELYRLLSQGRSQASLVLRPEATAGVMRAYHEGHLDLGPQPQRLYSLGSMFRHDRPQAGRYRQFHQFNVEVLGSNAAAIDAELIEMGWEWLHGLGLNGLRMELNSIGDETCRPAYLVLLRSYYRPLKERLCADCQRRLEDNPLRLLDCKRPECREQSGGAPRIIDHLCPPCQESIAEVRRLLEAAGIPYRLEPTLVRGLDYYTRTVFEYQLDSLDGAQSALGGGGRYDGLAKALGFPDTAGSGFAMGLERIVLSLPPGPAPAPAIELLVLPAEGVEAEAAARLTRLARTRVAAAADHSPRSLKAKMRSAARSGARWVAMVDPAEASAGRVRLRRMDSGEQSELSWEEMVEVLG